MSVKKIAIVGRGIAGLATAFRLVEAGHRVTLLGPRQADGTASFAAQGVSCTKGLQLAESPLFRAKLAGHAELSAWLDQIECAAQRPIARSRAGVYEPYFDAGEYQQIARRVFRENFTGCYGARNLGPQALTSRLPDREWFGRAPAGAFYYPRDLWFHPSDAMAAIESYLGASGTSILTEPVSRIGPHPVRGVVVTLASGELCFDEVVLAAGAGTEAVLEASGLPALRLTQVAGHVLDLRLPSRPTDVVMVKWGSSLALHEGTLRIGSTSFSPVDVHADEWAESEAELVAMLGDHYGLRSSLVGGSEATFVYGVRVRTRDRMPVTGALPFPTRPDERYFLLTGLYKNGLQLADLCARHIVRQLAGEAPAEVTAAFDAKRFR